MVQYNDYCREGVDRVEPHFVQFKSSERFVRELANAQVSEDGDEMRVGLSHDLFQ